MIHLYQIAQVGLKGLGKASKHFLSKQENVNSNTSNCFLTVFDIPQITQDIIHQIANKVKIIPK